MWDSQQEIENELDIERDRHARLVLLRRMAKGLGPRRFLRWDYWSILLFGL